MSTPTQIERKLTEQLCVRHSQIKHISKDTTFAIQHTYTF